MCSISASLCHRHHGVAVSPVPPRSQRYASPLHPPVLPRHHGVVFSSSARTGLRRRKTKPTLKDDALPNHKYYCSKSYDIEAVRRRVRRRKGGKIHCIFSISTFDEDSVALLSSSEGEESEADFLINPTVDTDLPISQEDKVDAPESALTLSGRCITAGHRRRGKRMILPGVFINLGLVTFLSIFLLLVDWWSWRIIRIPLQSFYLTRPFSISLLLSACAGYMYVPLLHLMKFYQVLRKEGPILHSAKKGTPTMAGLFFIPIGVVVARVLVGFSSVEVYGASALTLALAAIGLLNDLLSIIRSNHGHGLPGVTMFLLQVAVVIWFCVWFDSTKISSPYNMKYVVPLPSPFGLVHMGNFYFIVTAFCFACMSNGVNLTNELDGLAGGTAALACVGVSVAVLPLCPDLAVFGASIAGACTGFLFHNRFKASVFMGSTGSMALGGALAAIAACTGMFFPLFVSCGVFVAEVFSVMLQISYVKATNYVLGSGVCLFRVVPFHHHLESCGLKEPVIVASSYALSCLLAVSAAYIGLISA